MKMPLALVLLMTVSSSPVAAVVFTGADTSPGVDGDARVRTEAPARTSTAATAAVLERDADLQAAIDEAVAAVFAAGGSAADLPDVLGDLERAASGRPALLRQIVLFLATSTSTETAMSAAVLLHALEFSFEEKTEAVLPVLDATADSGANGNAGARALFYDVLGTIDRPEGGPADFTPYARLLAGADAHAGLVRYLYDVDPTAAVRLLQDVHGTVEARPFVGLMARIDRVGALLDAAAAGSSLTEDERGELARDLTVLSSHESWWVRLFGVTGLQHAPALADVTLRARLAGDAHPLVARAAAAIPER